MNRYNRTKDIVYLSILSLILVLSVILTVMLIVGNSKLSKTEKYLLTAMTVTEVPADSQTEPPAQNVINPLKCLYVLGEKDGKLTIYESDGHTVVDMLDTYVYSLPFADREAINKGIEVYSVNELVSLIQDYTS